MSGSVTLTAEQRERMERNRREALAKLAARQARQAQEEREKPLIKSTSDLPATTSTAQKFPAVTAVTRAVNKPIPEKNGLTALKCLDLKLSLISRSRFEVDTPFKAEIIDIFKSIPSREYNSSTRRWNFSLTDYSNLVKQLESLQSSGAIRISGLPDFVRKIFSEQLINGSFKDVTVKQFDLSPIDSCLVDNLFPFQREGINFGISRGGRVLVADEMGLGKTIQALGIAAYYRNDWPLLIVCPSSLRYTWAEAVQRWLPTVDESNIKILNSKRDVLPEYSGQSVVIVSYDLMVNLKSILANAKCNVVILDESHHIKNFKTQRYKAAEPILKKSSRVIMLSGTPVLSRPEELFCQIHCLRPKIFPLFRDFGARYCDPKETKWGCDYSGSSNMEELRILMEETIMIRRMKCDVLTQLPAKTRTNVVLNKESVKTNLKGLRKAAEEMERDDLKGMEKRGALLKFYAETAMAKQESVLDYISDFLESDRERKFLVFAHHAVMLAGISALLTRKGVGYIRIDGSISSEKRKQMCDQFQANETVKVAVLSITACSTGLTLTAASLVLFAELFWNPGTLVQAEDRVHRVGQENHVSIRYLCARGTADDYLWPLLQQKLGTLAKAGLSKNDFKDAETTYIMDRTLPETDGNSECTQRSIMDFFESISDTTIDDFSDLDLSVFDFDSDDEGQPASKKPK